MDKSKIEWTDATWNPVRGCSIVSKGCKNCYAMKVAHRFSGPGKAYEGLTLMSNGGPVWNGKITLVPDLLYQPLRWKRPRMIFVNSMSDLFHDAVPDSFIHQVFSVMARSSQHTFQILTKRPERMRDICSEYQKDSDQNHVAEDISDVVYWPFVSGRDDALQIRWPLKNVWLGVSAEDKPTYQNRVLYLAHTPAAVRFVSFEPLLEHIGDLMLDGIFQGAYQWAIVGGESGHKARPMHPNLPRSLRNQCVAASVPFFFKQWGEWCQVSPLAGLDAPGRKWHTFSDGVDMWRIGKKKAGRLLDGREWNEFPANQGRSS